VTVPVTGQLVARLAALGLITVAVQVTAVSQIELFGVNADLMPLVVGAVGLMTGSIVGACFGFVAGLFVDFALVETLGLSSLVYVVVGYSAGRVRELRDPQAALAPMALGAAATGGATIGFSLMEFLLGVDAPVSWLLIREIAATVLLNTLIALPVFGIVRRWLEPALPEHPRRRRRRAYTTAGLSPLSSSSSR
jgi:rod shape-determining protein MreD